MNTMRLSRLIWLFCSVVVLGLPGIANAQATFRTGSAASTVTATGHAELSGDINLTVVGGVSVSGRLEVSYPVPFANNETTGITAIGSGGLAGTTVVTAPSSGIVVLIIPPGAGPGSTLTLRGVRFSVEANAITTMNATLSSTGNFILAGQGIVPVVQAAASGFSLQTSAPPSYTVTNGVILTRPVDFVITEGYDRSFTGNIGFLGQTAPTQFIFQVIGLPDNVSLTFPTSVSSDTGATLTTDTGTSVTLTNQSASNRVTYLFGESLSSQEIVDIFTITPQIGTTGPSGTGTAFVQVAMGPLGIAVPDATHPVTSIPRFTENFVPPLSSIPGATISLAFPVWPLQSAQNIAVSNLGTGGAALSFRMSKADGTSVISEFAPVLAARETRVFPVSQVLGTLGDVTSISALQVESLNNRLVATTITSAPGGRTSAPPMKTAPRFAVPLNLTSATRDASVVITNPGAVESTVVLSLLRADGQAIAQTTRTLAPTGAFRSTLLSLFNVAANAVPANAHILGSASTPVRVSVFENANGPVEEVPGFAFFSTKRARYPYFVVGSGYTGLLSMVNASGFPIQVTVTPTQMSGAAFPGVTPYVRQLAISERLDLDLKSFFAGNALIAGSLGIDIERADSPNPFSIPLVAGAVRTGTSLSSAIVPLFTDLVTQFYLSPAAENSTAYTGIALMNETPSSVNVTIDAYAPTGALISSGTITLAPQSVQARLLRDVVPQALGLQEGLVRVTSAAPITALSFRGALNVPELLSLGPQQ